MREVCRTGPAAASPNTDDIRRYTAMTRLGWLVVRFVWEDAMHRQAYVRDTLADVVALRAQQKAVRAGKR